MLLGKRPRPPIKRTTSITEFTVDLSYIEDHHHMQNHHQQQDVNGFDRRLLATVSPRNPRRHSTDFLDTAHFLRTCGLCKRRLAPTRDIYMYRGDTAFCSLDCRQQQMNLDESKEKCSVASNLEGLSGTTVESEASSKGGTITAP